MEKPITNDDDLINSKAVERRIATLQVGVEDAISELEQKQEDEMKCERSAALETLIADYHVAANQLGQPASYAPFSHWLKEQSVHGVFGGPCSHTASKLDTLARVKPRDETEWDLDNPDVVRALILTDVVEDCKELADLLELRNAAQKYTRDWNHGVTLVAEGHFTEFAEDYAIGIGGNPPDQKWPFNHAHIDWADAAEELKRDYSGIDFDGETYYVR
jgi:hypothetical protein